MNTPETSEHTFHTTVIFLPVFVTRKGILAVLRLQSYFDRRGI
jgi:hypothetical protein